MFRARRAHHQERQIVSIQPLVAVGGHVVRGSEDRTPNAQSTLPHPGPPTYYNIRTIHHIAVTTVLHSWRWANDCLKHVELIQISVKLLLLHLVGHLCFTPTLMMHGRTQITFNRDFLYQLCPLLQINMFLFHIYLLGQRPVMTIYVSVLYHRVSFCDRNKQW